MVQTFKITRIRRQVREWVTKELEK